MRGAQPKTLFLASLGLADLLVSGRPLVVGDHLLCDVVLCDVLLCDVVLCDVVLCVTLCCV